MRKKIKNYFAFALALKCLGFHAAMHWTVLGFVMYNIILNSSVTFHMALQFARLILLLLLSVRSGFNLTFFT